ncbi:MAG: CAP domain-containing protein [Microgenomates group bacterium]
MEKLKNFFHHLFIPNEKNNYQAKLLQTDLLTFYLIIAVFINFAFKNINFDNVLGFATDITVNKLYQLTNEQREKNNLPPLQYNEKLACAAYKKAQDMFANNYWSHYSPTGKTPWEFILNCDYNYEYAGENLAKNFLFSDGVVTAWMNSPTHRENILKKDYTDVGFAIVNGVLNGEETTLVVQMFGKPLNSQLTKNQENFIKPVEAKENQQKLTTQNNPIVNNPQVLSQKAKKQPLTISFLNFNINLIFFTFLIVALILDFYFVVKFNIIRISGKNLTHLIFIFFIIIGLLIMTKGAII